MQQRRVDEVVDPATVQRELVSMGMRVTVVSFVPSRGLRQTSSPAEHTAWCGNGGGQRRCCTGMGQDGIRSLRACESVKMCPLWDMAEQ